MNRKLALDQLNRLTTEAYKVAEKHTITVALDNIRSKHNVGAVFRTSDAFRLERILLGGFTPCPPDRDIRKTAIGATETVDWQHEPDLITAVTQLKQNGYTIVSVEQTENSIPLQKLGKAGDKICVIFGNEVGGVDQALIDLSDMCLEIPQFGTKHSLNVSVCAGIVLWEMVKTTF